MWFKFNRVRFFDRIIVMCEKCVNGSWTFGGPILRLFTRKFSLKCLVKNVGESCWTRRKERERKLDTANHILTPNFANLMCSQLLQSQAPTHAIYIKACFQNLGKYLGTIRNISKPAISEEDFPTITSNYLTFNSVFTRPRRDPHSCLHGISATRTYLGVVNQI